MSLAVFLIALLAAKPARHIWPDKVPSALLAGDIVPVSNRLLESVFVPALIGTVAPSSGDALIDKPHMADGALGGVDTIGCATRITTKFPALINGQKLFPAVFTLFLNGNVLLAGVSFVCGNGCIVFLTDPFRVLSTFAAILLITIHRFKFSPADFTDFRGDGASPSFWLKYTAKPWHGQLRGNQNCILCPRIE